MLSLLRSGPGSKAHPHSYAPTTCDAILSCQFLSPYDDCAHPYCRAMGRLPRSSPRRLTRTRSSPSFSILPSPSTVNTPCLSSGECTHPPTHLYSLLLLSLVLSHFFPPASLQRATQALGGSPADRSSTRPLVCSSSPLLLLTARAPARSFAPRLHCCCAAKIGTACLTSRQCCGFRSEQWQLFSRRLCASHRSFALVPRLKLQPLCFIERGAVGWLAGYEVTGWLNATCCSVGAIAGGGWM
jgi:hypothetical protein